MKTHEYTEGFANLTLIIGVVLILLIGLFVFSTQSGSDPETLPVTEVEEVAERPEVQEELTEVPQAALSDTEAEEATTLTTQSEPVVENDVEEVAQVEEAPAPVIQAAAPGVFRDYDESLLANAADGDVVLFFHASWCPSCRALENDINSDLSAIPEGVTILQIDFDSATELKKKYGVVRQHTLVHVDANGNEIKKLTGLTNTLDQVVNQI